MKKSVLLVASALAVFANVAQSAEREQRWDKGYSKYLRMKAPVLSYADNTVIKGARTVLKRSRHGVCFSTDTRDLSVGAYTVWWMIFNNPEFCEGGFNGDSATCTLSDLGNPNVDATAMWAFGGLVGADHRAHFSACLRENDLTHQVLVGTNGLVDAKKAQIQIVFRHHGPAELADAATLGAQVSNYFGGCAQPDTGVAGFACEDLQYSVHH